MKERARELKAEARANKNRAAGEGDLLAKIAEMPLGVHREQVVAAAEAAALASPTTLELKGLLR